VLIVAAAGLLVGGGDDREIVAEVALERLEDVGSGRATLVREADGSLRLRLVESGLPPADDAYYEVWLIAPDITRMVSLGPLHPGGDYVVPRGIDPAEYPIVDISVEPVDGEPTHSGRSVLRGVFEA
jgi:anti-sigma-K factor RskA